MRLMGQYNGKWRISFVCVSTAIECVHMTSQRPCWRSKQRNGGHLGGVKYSLGDLTLSLCKCLLLFHYAKMASGHMRETLYTLRHSANYLALNLPSNDRIPVNAFWKKWQIFPLTKITTLVRHSVTLSKEDFFSGTIQKLNKYIRHNFKSPTIRKLCSKYPVK